MAAIKKITRVSNIHMIGGQAKPGTALASFGINMAEFTRQFNDKTKDRMGEVVPCQITAYSDKSFTFVVKTSPASVMLKKIAKIQSGAKNQKTDVAATITKEQALEIARYKMADLNVYDENAALNSIAGTARQMGIKITGLEQQTSNNEKQVMETNEG